MDPARSGASPPPKELGGRAARSGGAAEACGSRPVAGSGDDYGRPRRSYERHSGTGRSYEMKREGTCRGNCGTVTDEGLAQETVDAVNTEETAAVAEDEKKPKDALQSEVEKDKEGAENEEEKKNQRISHTDVNSMQPSRVTDFGALASAGFRIESLANLNTNTLFDLKPNTHTIINDPLQFGNYGKSISPTDITTTAAAAAATVGPQALIQQKGAQPNLVALRTGNIENWGESTMADTSPRTDTSTDPDIDERNHMVLEV